MKILDVDHITINLINVKDSCQFYENIFGFDKISDIDMGDHILHLYKLSKLKLELIEYKTKQKRVQAENVNTGIYRHFAMVVDDLEEYRKACEAAGYGINLMPTYISQINKTVMLIKDPNGVEIELIQA